MKQTYESPEAELPRIATDDVMIVSNGNGGPVEEGGEGGGGFDLPEDEF